MGQQQLLLIILGVIIVGIAIAVGITMFTSGSVQSNKDAIVNDLNNLAANAYQHRIRPCSMGGGGGNFAGTICTPAVPYTIPSSLRSNDNGAYTAVVTASTVTFTGTSNQGYGAVTAICDTTGKLGTFSYTLQFVQ
jgi:uncharacterized protein (UPF0333 family)